MPKQTPERIIDRKDSSSGYVTSGPGRIPVAGPDGVIALEWIPQGPGSGLNADLLDGLHADAFALVDHLHDDRYSLLDHLHDDRYSLLDHLHDDRYSLLDHLHDDRYSLLDHLHDDRYYTQTQLQTAGQSAVHWDNITNRPAQGYFFFHTEDSDLSGYRLILENPANHSEQQDSVTLDTDDGETYINAFVTQNPAGWGVSLIPAGIWEFAIYASVSSISLGDSFVWIRVYKRTAGGTETELFNQITPPLTVGIALHTLTINQPSFTLNVTDRLVVKLFGFTYSSSPITITFVYEGDTNASHFHYPTLAAPPHTHTLDDLSDVDTNGKSSNDVLTWDGSAGLWVAQTPATPPNVATDSIWDAKGDLAVATGNNTATRLGVGSDGYVLTADSTQTTGVKWAALPEPPEIPDPMPNLGFAYVTIPINSSQYYGLVHRYETLRLHFFENTSSSSLRVYYGETMVYESPSEGGSFAVNVDLSSFELTVGVVYSVRLRASNADTTTVYFMAEVAD